MRKPRWEVGVEVGKAFFLQCPVQGPVQEVQNQPLGERFQEPFHLGFFYMAAYLEQPELLSISLSAF